MNLKIINIFLFITFYLVGSTSARKHRKHKVDDLAFLEPNILDDNYNSKEYLKRKIRNRKLSNSIYREIKNIIEDDRKNSDENSEINNYKKKDSNEKIGSEKINSVRYKEKEPLENLTEEFAVEINGNADVASEVAKKHGFTILRHVSKILTNEKLTNFEFIKLFKNNLSLSLIKSILKFASTRAYSFYFFQQPLI